MDEAEVNIRNLLASNDKTEAEKKAALVEEILHRYSVKTLDDTDEILYYNGNGIYVKGAESKILQELDVLGDYLITNHMRGEVLATIRARTYTARSKFDKDPNVLNLNNGFLDVDAMEFHYRQDIEKGDRLHGYLSMSQLPIDYDPDATCPAFIKFLREILEPEYIGTVAKLLGYLLYRKSVFHKAFMFCGEGSNGKSTLINVIEAFIGKENRASRTLQDITMNRFAKADLYGKLANLCDDVPAKKIENTGDFKMLVAGDSITAERKHQQPFTFENYAKLIFSANQIPESDDQSYAYYRRWVIIPFLRVFEGDEVDEHLLENLTSPEELSGILNLAIRNLRRLKQERGFNDVGLEEIKHLYELGASKIRAFIEEQCILKPGEDGVWVQSSHLRDAYRRYCIKQGTKYFDERKFGEALKALGAVHKQKRIGKARPWCEFGIGLKSSGLMSQVNQSLLDCTENAMPPNSGQFTCDNEPRQGRVQGVPPTGPRGKNGPA